MAALSNRGMALSAISLSTLALPSSAFLISPCRLQARSFTSRISIDSRPLDGGITRVGGLPCFSRCPTSLAHLRSPGLRGAAALHISGKTAGIAIAAASVTLLTGSPVLAETIASVSSSGGLASAQAALQAATAGMGSFFFSPEMKELAVYLAKTLIAWGIPVGAIGIVVISAVSAARRGDDGKFDSESPQSLVAFLKGQKPGEPVEYLRIQRLNDKLESFQYSLQRADEGRRPALAQKRRTDFRQAFGAELERTLSDRQIEQILIIDKQYRELEERIQAKLDSATAELRTVASAQGALKAPPAASDGGKAGGRGPAVMMEAAAAAQRRRAAEARLADAAASRTRNEATYISEVSALLDPEQRARLEALLASRAGAGVGWAAGAAGGGPLSLAPGVRPDGAAAADRKHVYVLSFPGDISASQVEALRQEVTAVVRAAHPGRGDEAVLVLNSGGGTVTGYGLAAAQLARLKNAGLRLTICIEQVAASGGYMMACVGDRVCASPFAVVGSIGVISEIPNVYERLQREGVEFQTVTAGRFKRTLTPFKKPADEDFKKSKEDIEQVFELFKKFVKAQRPAVDIDAVATGETWFGPDALSRKLVDELITTDDVLLQLHNQGCEILSVKYADPSSSTLGRLLPAGFDDGAGVSGGGILRELAMRAALQWLGSGPSGPSAAAGWGAAAAAELGGGAAGLAGDKERAGSRVMAVDRDDRASRTLF